MNVICKYDIQQMPLEKSEAASKDEEIIICAYCSSHITDPSKQIAVNDSFRHVFANPHGYVFEIGCFSEASGCRPASSASNEFSWFMGYAWEIGVCQACAGHLGWVFSSNSKQFYGLILEKLIFP